MFFRRQNLLLSKHCLFFTKRNIYFLIKYVMYFMSFFHFLLPKTTLVVQGSLQRHRLKWEIYFSDRGQKIRALKNSSVQLYCVVFKIYLYNKLYRLKSFNKLFIYIFMTGYSISAFSACSSENMLEQCYTHHLVLLEYDAYQENKYFGRNALSKCKGN